MVDCRNRVVKPGDRVKVMENIASVDGMLYQNTIVTIDDEKGEKARVVDKLGKIHWVTPSQISTRYL